MGTVNRVILVGNLGRDAELRYTGTGTPVAKFSVATTETYKGRDGEKKEETEWHRINLWGKSAETLAQYLTKGKQVYVEGRLKTQKWKDKEGADRTTVEVTADKVTLFGGGSRSQAASREETGHEAGAGSDLAVPMPGDDEVPF